MRQGDRGGEEAIVLGGARHARIPLLAAREPVREHHELLDRDRRAVLGHAVGAERAAHVGRLTVAVRREAGLAEARRHTPRELGRLRRGVRRGEGITV